MLAAIFVLPLRVLGRLLVYGKRSNRFYRGHLELLDARGKRIYTLSARTGYAHVEEAFDRILDELAERDVSFEKAA